MIDGSGHWRYSAGLSCDRGRSWARHVVSGVAAVCLIAPLTSACADEIAYGYDALGRLVSVSSMSGTAYYDYDAAGNITAIRRAATVSSVPSAPSVRGTGSSDMGDAETLPALTTFAAR